MALGTRLTFGMTDFDFEAEYMYVGGVIMGVKLGHY